MSTAIDEHNKQEGSFISDRIIVAKDDAFILYYVYDGLLEHTPSFNNDSDGNIVRKIANDGKINVKYTFNINKIVAQNYNTKKEIITTDSDEWTNNEDPSKDNVDKIFTFNWSQGETHPNINLLTEENKNNTNGNLIE